MSDPGVMFPVMSDQHISQPKQPQPPSGQPDTAEFEYVPLISEWAREWGLALVLAAIVPLVAIYHVGHRDGPVLGWFLFCLLLAAAIKLWYLDYRRRSNAAEAARQEKLHRQSSLDAVDAMAGHQFEEYYASLIRLLGWRDVRVIGRAVGGDGGADILATDPNSRRAAIQCKRYALSRTVSIDEVRKLNGALGHEHPGRRGIIVTTSRPTKSAAALAERSGIEIVARPTLADQMTHARRIVDRRGRRSDTRTPPRPTDQAPGSR